MTIFIILAYSIIAFVQSLALVRKKRWRDLVFGSILLACAFVLTLLYSLGVHLPNPNAEAGKLLEMLNIGFDYK